MSNGDSKEQKDAYWAGQVAESMSTLTKTIEALKDDVAELRNLVQAQEVSNAVLRTESKIWAAVFGFIGGGITLIIGAVVLLAKLSGKDL